MTLRRSWPFFVGILSTVSTVVAQPAATETKPAAAATPPAASAPATSAPAATTPAAPAADAKPADTKPAVEPSPQQKEFDKRLKEWNDLREKLGTLQIDYKSAKPEERAPIVEKFKQTLVEGEKLQPTIIAAAEAAFAADAKSEGPANFLAALAQNFYAADRYEESLKTSEALIRGNFSNKRIYNLAGKAAFNLCDFDKAEKYLKQGQEASALDARGDRYLVLAPLYKPLWAKEQELRAAEAKSDLPRVQLKTTQGDITLELFENEAPQTVGNFVNLVEKGFYDGLSFHRVIAEFMAQGGDPKGDGTGGPGYDIPCECYKPERRLHFRGTLSMAHAGKDTGGSQFFITFLPTSNLDGAAVDAKNTGTPHTVFGRVIEGLDVLAKLQRREPPGPHSFDRSASPPGDKILSAKVLRKRNHPYEPTKVGPPPAAKTDAPKTEPAKTEPAKTDAPKSEAPKTEAPKSDAPKAETPKTDAPKTDAPKKDVPTLEPPKSDAPKTDAPKSDAPKTEPKP